MRVKPVWSKLRLVDADGRIDLVQRGMTLLIVLLACASTKYLSAQSDSEIEFQIRTDLYADDTKEPSASSKIIFTDGMYFELDEDQGLYTVMDPRKGRITLLNKNKKALVHLDMHVIEQRLSEAMQISAPVQQASFNVSQEPGGYFSLGNGTMKYTFLPMQAEPEIASKYGDFANWSQRIQALYISKMPPQMRLQLNKLMIDQSQLPSEVRRTIHYKQGTDVKIARMNLTQLVSNEDRSKVASIIQWMQQFKPTSENDFFK